MTYLYIYYAIIAITAIAAIILHLRGHELSKSNVHIKFKKYRLKSMASSVKTRLTNKELDKVFLSSGVKLTSTMYNTIRYSLFAIWIAIIVISYLMNGYIQNIQLVICIGIFILTIPAMTIAGYKTPFNYIITVITLEYKHRKNLEINRAMSQLKNLSIISTNANIGSDFIIEELMKMTKITKPVFATTLKLWRENDREEAAEYFATAIDTREGKELANIFLKLDDLGPDELKEQLMLCQAIFSEERRTNKERRNETRGYVLYTIVIMSIFAILLNFVVLILYVNTIEVFKNMQFNQFNMF